MASHRTTQTTVPVKASKAYSASTDAELKVRAMVAIRGTLVREKAIVDGELDWTAAILKARSGEGEPVRKDKDTKMSNEAVEGFQRYLTIKGNALVKMIELVDVSVAANQAVVSEQDGTNEA